MYKFFQRYNTHEINTSISCKQIESFKIDVLSKMMSWGATEREINLVTDEVVRVSIINKHNPDDLAWAMMQ